MYHHGVYLYIQRRGLVSGKLKSIGEVICAGATKSSKRARGERHGGIVVNHTTAGKGGVATESMYIPPKSSDSISWIRSTSLGASMPEVAPWGGKSTVAFLAGEPGQLGAGGLDPDVNARHRWPITVRLATTSGAEWTGGLEPGSINIF